MRVIRAGELRGCRGIDRPGDLCVTEQRHAEPREDRHRDRELLALAAPAELLDAAVDHEALEAAHAIGDRGPASSRSLPGTTPPQKPTSTAQWPFAAARFAAKPSRVVVGGIELSGMSTSVVTPPIAAARCAAVAKPSHSVRPGSLRCTWVSTMPGRIASLAPVVEANVAGDVVPAAEPHDLAAEDMDRRRDDALGRDHAMRPDDELHQAAEYTD